MFGVIMFDFWPNSIQKKRVLQTPVCRMLCKGLANCSTPLPACPAPNTCQICEESEPAGTPVQSTFSTTANTTAHGQLASGARERALVNITTGTGGYIVYLRRTCKRNRKRNEAYILKFIERELNAAGLSRLSTDIQGRRAIAAPHWSCEQGPASEKRMTAEE